MVLSSDVLVPKNLIKGGRMANSRTDYVSDALTVTNEASSAPKAISMEDHGFQKAPSI